MSKLNEKILSKVHYSEYWEKPCASWGNTQTWDSFFYGRNQNATKQMSHDALGKELDLLIKYLKPETREIQKAYAIQKELRHRKKNEEKENILPPSKTQQSHIVLFCLIKGDASARAFPVKIDKEETIAELKNVIKEKIVVPIANDLKIWKVEIPDDDDEKLANLLLNDRDELLATKKIRKYFPKEPTEEHIHIIISLPETVSITPREQELLDQLAELQKNLVSIYEFDVVVNPKRKGFKWVANIEQVTLCSLKETIFAIYKIQELEEKVLSFICNGEKYYPQNDLEFRNMLQLFATRNNITFTVIIETSSSFSLWTFPKICQLYGLGNDNLLSVFPIFSCECIELNKYAKSQEIIKHLIDDLEFRFNTIPIGNEASKSQYVCAYLVAVANLLKFKVRLEKNVSGQNDHGPVDFAFVSIQTSRVVGITEVKDKDFLQGVAQNAVQCESALSNNNKRVFGIITDSEKWLFLECSLDNEGKPKFKLSKPMVVVYGDEDMEDRVKKVLGNIAWLLEETQRLDEPEDENLKD